MRSMLGVSITMLVVTLVPWLSAAQSAEQELAQTRLRAEAVARRFLERAQRVRSSDIVPCGGLSDAVIGDVIFVHDPVTLGRRYELVSLRSGAGKMIGVVAVDAQTDTWLWSSLQCRGDSLLPVSEVAARRRLTREREAADRQSGMPGEAGSSLGGGILVDGHDKHIYWRFSSGGESWLVDALDAGARVLGSADGSDACALTCAGERPVCEPPVGDRSRDDDASGEEEALAATLPPSFVLPGMPYHFQITDWYCGPAALQMVMDWYGEEVPQPDIAHVANDRAWNPGVERTDLRRAAHFSGMSTAIQDSSLHGYRERKLGYSAVDAYFSTNRAQRLKTVVAAGYPVIALMWWDIEHHAWHYRVVKGYDDSLSVFVCHDPWYWGGWWGPDVLIDQSIFVNNLWQYSFGWAMMATPWEVTPSISPSEPVAIGDTISVDLKVRYPGPGRFDNLGPCSSCEATISLPSGLALAGGTATISLPDLVSGDSALVHWDVLAVGPAGKWGIALEARGLASDSARSYPSYTDSIGGYAYEEVSIGSEIVANWESEEMLTPGPGVAETCFPGSRAMVVSGDGTVHVVWSSTLDGVSDVYYRERVGGVWSDETRLTNSAATSNNPCIAEGPDGRLHVGWSDLRDGNYEIYYKFRDPAGGWSADERVTYYDEVDCYPSIAVSDTAVHLVWERHTSDSYRVAYVAAASRIGGSWSPAADVDASPARDSYRPSIACGSDGLVHVVYERQTSDSPDERECIAHRSWDGATWSSTTEISSGVSFSRTPSITVGADARVHAVWQDGENVGGDIFYRCLDGGTWEPVEQIVTGSMEASTPSPAVDAPGVVHVAWVDNRQGASEIYLVSKADTGWGAETRLSRAAGASLVPTVAAGTGGDVCIVWTDTRSGSAQVYFRERASNAGVTGPTGRTGEPGITLSTAHPQPFSDRTQVAFTLAAPSDLKISVFDVKGRMVKLLASGAYGAGTHSAVWDGTCTSGDRVAPGVYYVRCNGHAGDATKAVVLVK